MRYGLLLFSVVCNVLLLGFLVSKPPESLQPSGQNYSPSATQYPYISKRVFASQQNDLVVNFVQLRTILRTELAPYTNVGMYFEYLPTGTSIGINEDREYVQASLLKVPLAMAVLKKVESGQLRTNMVLTVEQQDIDPNFGTLHERGVGTRLSVGDAIYQVLVNSDNTARNLFFKVVSQEEITDVYDYLGIPKDFGDEPTVSAKNYSSILRSLYFSSYINPQNSYAILDLLTRSEFSDKIVAGVPDGVLVAHKIGVRNGRPGVTDVFTDCGIIYLTKRPYLLCVMTEMSESDAQRIMSSISKVIYDYISAYSVPD